MKSKDQSISEIIQQRNGKDPLSNVAIIAGLLGAKAFTKTENGRQGAYYQQFLDNFPVAVYTCDEKGYLRHYNKAAVELFGREPQPGKDLWCASWKAYRPNGSIYDMSDCPMAIAIKEGKTVFGQQLIIERPDGTRRIVLPHPQPFFNDDKEIVGGINVVIDITARKQTEYALQDSELIYRQLIEGLPAAIYTCDAEGRILIYNEAAVALWGREPVAGKDLWCGSWKIYKPNGEPLPLDECPMAVALKESRTVTGEEIIVERPDGVKRYIAPHPNPFFDASGRLAGAVNMLVDITDYKTTEENIAKLAAIVQSSDDAIISKTLNGIVRSWNNAAERIFGYTAEEMIGESITKIIPTDRLDEETNILNRLRSGDRIDHFETRRITKDGRLVDISLTISPIKDSSGVVIGASKIARDITAQRKAEQRIRESEERLRQATQSADLGTFHWDMATGQFSFSDRLAHIFGHAHASPLTHEDMVNAIYPEDQAVRDKAYEKAFKTGNLFYEVRIILPNKRQSLRWIRVNGKITFDDNLQPVKIQGIVMDITEPKEAEQRIRESEERLRLAAEAAGFGTWDLDLLTGLTVASPEHQKIIGYPGTEQWGIEKFMQYVHPHDREMVQQAFQQALQTGRMVYEARIIRADSTERWIRVNGTTFYDKKHTPVRLLGTIVDITEQKKAKDELEKMVMARTRELLQTNEQLEKSNQELEQFAYIASHDLQEPLRKIQTFTDLVKDHLDDKVLSERYFTKISSSAQRMSMLISDVLNYSRLTKTNERFVDVDLTSVLNNVLSDFELLIEQKQPDIQHSHLPVIKAIPLQMHQLFSNLISNSLKFSEEKPQITIISRILLPEEVKALHRLKPGITYVQITFKDNGIGFEQQYAEQIFIIFQRLNNQKAYSGTGIGLALCKKIVEHHHGIIMASGEKDKGATFTVILPLLEQP